MGRILIKDIDTLVTMNSEHGIMRGVDLLVDGNRIAELGIDLEPGGDVREIDGSRHVVYPGFVNTHHHFSQRESFPRSQPHNCRFAEKKLVSVLKYAI